MADILPNIRKQVFEMLEQCAPTLALAKDALASPNRTLIVLRRKNLKVVIGRAAAVLNEARQQFVRGSDVGDLEKMIVEMNHTDALLLEAHDAGDVSQKEQFLRALTEILRERLGVDAQKELFREASARQDAIAEARIEHRRNVGYAVPVGVSGGSRQRKGSA